MQPWPDYLQQLGSVVFGATIGTGLTWVASRITRSREREHWRWERKADLLDAVRQNVGVLRERLALGHKLDEESAQQLGALADSLRRQVGLLHPSRDLQRAVRDFAHSASIVIHDRGLFEGKAARETALGELESRCDEVFRLSDKALEK